MSRLVVLALIFFGAGCAALTAAQRGEIEKTAGTIGSCQERGRACKDDGGTNCYAKYDACITDAGLRGEQ